MRPPRSWLARAALASHSLVRAEEASRDATFAFRIAADGDRDIAFAAALRAAKDAQDCEDAILVLQAQAKKEASC